MANLIKKFREQKVRFYADDRNSVTVGGDLYVYGRNLTADEFRKVVSRVKRGIPKMLEGIPYADFGTDNIQITNKRSNP